jgi:hypothetical protein
MTVLQGSDPLLGGHEDEKNTIIKLNDEERKTVLS